MRTGREEGLAGVTLPYSSPTRRDGSPSGVGLPYCLDMNGLECLRLHLEARGETRGQRVGCLSSQREQGCGCRFEGTIEAAWEEEG